LRAIFWATSCFLGTFWAVDFLAVCLVRAILDYRVGEGWVDLGGGLAGDYRGLI
jgi:hypothetical protein